MMGNDGPRGDSRRVTSRDWSLLLTWEAPPTLGPTLTLAGDSAGFGLRN